MEFDLKAFEKASFKAREASVPVPDLAHFFKDLEEGQTPVWLVRGLEGEELARVNESQERSANLVAVTEALMTGQPDQLKDTVNQLLGHTGEVPSDLARRQAILVAGSVAPKVSQQVAVKLAKAHPIEFYSLTTEIIRLTGLGSVPGKPMRSSRSQTSK